VCGHPIASAPSLTQPDDGVLPCTQQRGPQHANVSTSARPVALSHGPGPHGAVARKGHGGAAIGGVVAFGIALVGMIVWMVAERPGVRAGWPGMLAIAIAATVPASAPPTVPIPPTVPGAPKAPSTDLSLSPLEEADAASPSAIVPAGVPPRGGAHRGRTTTKVQQQDCQPPYVIDRATGDKRWRLECL
jgi:hypothetical protein